MRPREVLLRLYCFLIIQDIIFQITGDFSNKLVMKMILLLRRAQPEATKSSSWSCRCLYLWWLLLGACLPWFTETIGIFRVIWKERHTSCTFFWLNPSINFVCVINYYLSPTLGFPNTTRSRRAKPSQVSLHGEVNQRTNVVRCPI